MANTANGKLTTDFNVFPYYDDFDENKQFYRILYKPGYAVQARELTQMQTILQNQVNRFGNHIFKEGSIVIPGRFNLQTANTITGPVDYVKVKDIDNANNDVEITNFQDVIVKGQTTNIEAEISLVVDGTESTSNTKTIFVNYLNASNSNSSISVFQPGEILTSNTGNLVVLSSNPTGKGSTFSISEGVIFAKEHFIYFPNQTVVLDRYGINPSAKVGFTIVEEIVNSAADASLLDPALESSNFSAPGADRLKLSPILTVTGYDEDTDPNDFILLFTIKEGIVQIRNDRSQYNILQDEMAKRTFDESGDYYVQGLDITLKEHLNDGVNGGYLLAANGGNSNLISVQVSPGTAYVKGYEIGTLATTYLSTEKSQDYKNVNSQIVSATMGSYVTVNEFVGNWILDKGTTIDLYDTEQKRISSKKFSLAAQTGNKIGTAKIATLEYNDGTLGTADALIDIFLTDISMLGSNTFSNVKSIYLDNTGSADIGADIVLVSNTAQLQETTTNPLLYYVGSNYTKTIKPGGVSDTTYYYKTTTSVSISNQGTFTLSLPTGADLFPYGTTNLTTSQKRDIVISLSSNVSITMAGSVSNTATGNTLVGSGTDFTKLNVGDKIAIDGVSNVYFISSIANSSHLVVAGNFDAPVYGNTFTKVYKTGDIIDLTTKGANTGAVRTVSATPTSLSFDLKEGSGSSVSATVSYKVGTESAIEISKVLKPDRFVVINCASHVNGTNGTYSLGFSDVYKIKEIRKKTGAFTSNTEGTNVTNNFILNSGQTDMIYDHSSITAKNLTLSNTDNLLVRLDYFAPDFSTGYGFFSIDSYPIDDALPTSSEIKTEQIPIFKSPTTGKNYDLRNYIDFRPVKSAVSSDSTTVAGATSNPGSSTGFTFDSFGMRFPVYSSPITFDYQYYLARKDVIAMSPDRIFSIIKGVSSESPITPPTPDNLMTLATMYIAPYPSLSLYYANLAKRRDLACIPEKTASVRFTMRDIGVLKDRIINLEYYASLSLLEKNAVDLKILDENGLDRFKNGIFVDTFTSHDLGATYNPDYRIVVDPEEKSIRPIYTMESIQYDYSSVDSTNITKTGNLLTLSYTEVPWLQQNAATTIQNTERTTWRFIGKANLTPSDDVWVDTLFAPDESVFLNTGALGQTVYETGQVLAGIAVQWNSWQTVVTGYKVYRGSATASNLVGTYSTLSAAQAAANQIRNTSNAVIETLTNSSRTGTQNYFTTQQNAVRINDKVIDTSLIPYIRPQTLKVEIKGLKPFARHYVYIDDINMSSYVTPLTQIEYGLTITGLTYGNYTTSNEGSPLIADENGLIYALIRLPAGSNVPRFKVGTKTIIISDIPNTSDINDASSYAITYFTAQGLAQQKQDTIISTAVTIPVQRTVSGTQSGSQLQTLGRYPPPPPPGGGGDVEPRGGGGNRQSSGTSCMAYTFTITAPLDEEGMFLTSVDVFCAAKHPTLDLWIEVRELDAGGQITQNQVPYSEFWVNNSSVQISTDGKTNATRITFPAPIFLMNGKSYALVLHPESLNPNYYFWIAKIGQTDVNTTQSVNSRIGSGALYITNNGINWNEVPDADLTCRFYRASFATGVVGTAVLKNKPVEKMFLSNVSSDLTGYGDTYTSGNKLTLSSISGGTINIGDLIIGSTSGANSAVVNKSGSVYAVANIGYTSGESATVRLANGYLTPITATIQSIETGTALLSVYQSDANTAVGTFISSNSKFIANDTIFSLRTGQTAKVDKIERFRYSLVDAEPAFLQFGKTSINFSMLTYSNTATAGSYVNVSPNDNYYFTDERALFSASYPTLVGTSTNRLKAQMSTTSSYLSPVLDVGRTQTILVNNIINNSNTNETLASGGDTLNKYISKVVTLAQGQDAEDINVFLTAYRPPNTDIKVYVRILNAEDSGSIDDRSWIEMETTSTGIYSSLADRNDFKDFKYTLPASVLTGTINGTTGIVQYTNSQGITFTGYKSFAIKIGLLADNSAVVPRVADLRVIALQK